MVTRAAVLAKASEWVGMMERTGNNDIWFADDWGITGSSWCFAFVQSCFYYAIPSPSGALPHQSMYCPYGIQWARDNHQAIEVGGAPIPGDVVFFSWDMSEWPRDRPGTGDHVGIVEGWDGGDVVSTIEGNIGSPQGVYRKNRSISGTVVCFWRPAVYGLGPITLPPAPEDDMYEQADRDRAAQTEARVNALWAGFGGDGRLRGPDALMVDIHELIRREVHRGLRIVKDRESDNLWLVDPFFKRKLGPPTSHLMNVLNHLGMLNTHPNDPLVWPNDVLVQQDLDNFITVPGGGQVWGEYPAGTLEELVDLDKKLGQLLALHEAPEVKPPEVKPPVEPPPPPPPPPPPVDPPPPPPPGTGPLPPVTRPPDAVNAVADRVKELEARFAKVEAALEALAARFPGEPPPPAV